MAITLGAITLPDDLIWRDEYGWSNVVQDVKRSIVGTVIIQEASQVKGRIITLTGSQNSGWIDRATLDLLLAQVNTPDNTMVLTFHGTIYNVMFSRSGNTSPVKTQQIYDISNPTSEHVYSVALKFIEV